MMIVRKNEVIDKKDMTLISYLCKIGGAVFEDELILEETNCLLYKYNEEWFVEFKYNNETIITSIKEKQAKSMLENFDKPMYDYLFSEGKIKRKKGRK